ncbi:tyrosine-type recombinase/integrase [Anaeroarcus burkinensis]|uniref:tyrosine-type recombinase/integrase n=1 Tax=Anaeroarcus burkinensis TaxID=82376 RepID=UPI000406B2AF|nr:site-specific integrase [Anaeroarcus burkinensis]
MAKKIKKRSNGEGCIRLLDDGRWEARIRVLDPVSGLSKIKTFSRKTQKEVTEWLNEIKAQMHMGTYIGERKMTVQEWLETWLNEYAKPKVRQTTWESYESVIRRHVVPHIGMMRIQSLKPEHLQRLFNEKIRNGRVDGKGGLSATTVRYINAAINQAFKQAVKNQIISRNIAELVEKPKVKKHEISPLTKEQINKFLECAKGHKFYEAFLIECFTGLRRGELLGLRWKDIDFEKYQLTVNQSVNVTRTGLKIAEPKTKTSKRTIPLTEQVMVILKIYRKRQIEERLRLGIPNTYDLIFCNEKGQPFDPTNFVRQFESVLKMAELPRVRFHDMRHTHATLLLAQGENIKVVQERLGHTTVRMTLDTYSHVLPGMQKNATERISKILSI